MELKDSTVLILGGAGLVGLAVARDLIPHRPKKLVLASLWEQEAHDAVAELSAEAEAHGVELEGAWGDLFVPHKYKHLSRRRLLEDPEARAMLVDDVYSSLTDEVLYRSSFGRLLADTQPDAVVDCVNTAGALAYQDVFGKVAEVREQARDGEVDIEAVDRLLSTLYLPHLIRHAQIALSGMRKAGTDIYVKVGTAGTGGMGLNIPFTHSEERPSRVLLAKSGLAGAHTLLLFLMARTPDGPAVKEVKPTAAISWKSIGSGPVYRAGRPMTRSDASGPMPIVEAFRNGGAGYVETGEELEGVFLDAGENGLFSLPEFETLTALGLMEFVTPEEIAENVVREITSHPTGKDVVAALDAATMGPTYRAGVLRTEAIKAMEALERVQGAESVAYEMLGPPRLSKLLFEAQILRRLFHTLAEAGELDPSITADRAAGLLQDDDDLRQRMLSIGIPIVLPDGGHVLRGSRVVVEPPEGVDGLDEPTVHAGWVDLRASSWEGWRERVQKILAELATRPTVLQGSISDRGYGDDVGEIRPGRLVAWIFRTEDEGRRTKR